MKILRYHISLILLWAVSLTLSAQNDKPTFVVDYKNAESTNMSQSGIGFASNADGTKYSLSTNGKYQSKYDLSKINYINRYYDPPVTHVYSDEATSEAIVKEVRDDGTVVLDAATAKEVPQVGEIIVSGVTDAAPYGFLKHVESVEQKNGKIIVKTSDASLNEVLPNAHIEQPLVFREVNPGANAISPSVFDKPSAPNGQAYVSKDDVTLKLKKTFTFPEKPTLSEGAITFDDLSYPEYIEGSVTIDLELGGDFIYDSDGWLPDRCGVTLNGSLGVKLDVEAGLKANWESKLGEVPLQPIGFIVFGIPVVIEPTVQFRCGIKPKGKVYAKWTPLDVEALSFDTHLIWNRQEDIYGKHWDGDGSYDSDFKDWSWKEFFKDMANFEMGLSGEAKFAVWPEIRFKLYNAESISLALGISPYAKLSGEIGFKWKAEDWSNDDFLVKDDLSLSAGADLSLEGKMEFKIPFTDKKLGGKIEEDIGVVDVPLVQRGTIIPAFNDFRVYPEDNAKERENVHVSALRGEALMSMFADYEEDFGFCIAQEKKDNNGKVIPKEWTFYSLKSKYQNSSLVDLDGQYKVEMDLPTNVMEPNATYDVRPYTKIRMYSDVLTVKRKGGKFKTGGSPGGGGGVVIDVPGEDL